ncbi:MAG: dienelactone hydrolase family protein [Burkholderiales bacterium]|nr:dienelactone hydrolase family protein [Burkholderiales bacterium]
MNERLVAIATAAGSMETFVTHPQRSGPFPAVIVYMDFWGVREELFDIARRIATVGYYCMVPDLYYRQGRVRNAFRNQQGQMLSLAVLSEAQKAAVREPMSKLTDQMTIDDTGAILQFIDRGEPVHPLGMGAIGYCLGGRLVFRVAGSFPERFRAGASMHGTRLVTEGADSAHSIAAKTQGEIYCGFGEKDPWSPPATVAAIEQTLNGAAVRYSWRLHAGAEHGYALPDRDIYDKQAANRDWESIFAMFRRQLPDPA